MAGGTGRYGSCKWKHVFPRVKVQDMGIPKVNELALKKKSVLLISHCNGEEASSVSCNVLSGKGLSKMLRGGCHRF